MKKLDKILIILAVFLSLFIITMVVLFCIFQSTPDALIGGVLGSGGLEALICGAIKCTSTISENKVKSNDEELG